MSTPTSSEIATFREAAHALGERYDYDIAYMEALLEASPGAYRAFTDAVPMAHYRQAARAECVAVAKITAMRAEDCGSCVRLLAEMAREEGVCEEVIRATLRGGSGLPSELREIREFAHAVAANGDFRPERREALEALLGREAMAELAIAIASTRIFPTLKRALGYASPCALEPALE